MKNLCKISQKVKKRTHVKNKIEKNDKIEILEAALEEVR